MKYAPEQIRVKLIGTARTSAGAKFNVFSTICRKHVLMYPIAPSGRQIAKGIPFKVTDLSPKIRRRLGC
jgi:hypothetical protein